MKRAVIVVLVLICALSLAAAAQANLLTNPGFEAGSTGWGLVGAATILDAATTPSQFIHSGSKSLGLGPETGYATQTFILPDASLLEFGAWVRLGSSADSGDFDQSQISLWLFSEGTGEVIGGSVTDASVFGPLVFDQALGVWLSDWVRLAGLVDICGLGGTEALININLQDYSEALSVMAADDAFARPVPEPATMLLLGGGLLGLAGLKRRIKN